MPGLQELAEERERLAKQKELEVARLRAMQEKIQDTRSAQDEERAKRYQVRGCTAGAGLEQGWGEGGANCELDCWTCPSHSRLCATATSSRRHMIYQHAYTQA